MEISWILEFRTNGEMRISPNVPGFNLGHAGLSALLQSFRPFCFFHDINRVPDLYASQINLGTPTLRCAYQVVSFREEAFHIVVVSAGTIDSKELFNSWSSCFHANGGSEADPDDKHVHEARRSQSKDFTMGCP